jgi:hypothetical protein
MRPNPLRLALFALVLLALGGCASTTSCSGGDDAYLKAKERPRLDLPAGVMGSERIQPVVIPPASPDPTKLDPEPRCLDYPPQYFAKPPAAPGSPESVVRAWNVAWSEHKPDVVMKAYSPAFQSDAAGGATAFLAEREQQVATGSAPSAELANLTVTKSGKGRRAVTFSQTFGDTRVRRELVLVRDGQNWLIVSEKVLPGA